MKINVIESKTRKSIRSPLYNYDFNKVTGHFIRWGQTIADEHDPKFAPGPEILDIEISAGKCSGACRFCYKGNNPNLEAYNMTLNQFKTILDKINNEQIIIDFEDGSQKVFNSWDKVKTNNGIKYVRDLTENDDIL